MSEARNLFALLQQSADPRTATAIEEFVRLEVAHDLNHLRQIDSILGRCVAG
jgi:predicted Zn-ribbon and HTH transcriptional regulator